MSGSPGASADSRRMSPASRLSSEMGIDSAPERVSTNARVGQIGHDDRCLLALVLVYFAHRTGSV